jgi:hypothetical protein
MYKEYVNVAAIYFHEYTSSFLNRKMYRPVHVRLVSFQEILNRFTKYTLRKVDRWYLDGGRLAAVTNSIAINKNFCRAQ